ncbi:MAG: adenylate kinase [Chitinophagaceae bacterium]|nr:adenylate kinase [Chitinophagaceae bacterium]
MLNIVLFGSPGSGKGTQSTKIIQKYNLNHLSTGDIFRKHLSQNTELGLLAQKYMNIGKLVPDEIVLDMVNDSILYTQQKNGFVFDGFPRTIAQAEAFDNMLKKNKTCVHIVIVLEVEEDILKQRIKERGKTSGRSDDTDEHKINTRLNIYKEETLLLSDYYQAQKKWYPVNGLNSVDVVFADICNIIDSLR